MSLPASVLATGHDDSGSSLGDGSANEMTWDMRVKDFDDKVVDSK